MKKIILFICLFVTTVVSANNERHNNFSISIHYSRVNNSDVNPIIFGIAWNKIYFDFGSKSKEKPLEYGNEHIKNTTFHVGLQIPIYKYLKITPLIGQFNEKNSRFDYDGGKSRLVLSGTIHHFDYGGQCQFIFPLSKNVKYFGTVNITITNNMKYFGLGMCF